MAIERTGAINWKGNPTDLTGPEIKVGDQAPAGFTAVAQDMTPVTGKDMAGKTRILCTVPSLDTPVCDIEMQRFNTEAASLPNAEVWVVSVDLPFAQKRWCGATKSDKIRTLSDWKDRSFGTSWGTWAAAKGLHARAVFVVGKNDKVLYAEYVSDAVNEPDYKKALDAARGDA